jgi:hypothetical protein
LPTPLATVVLAVAALSCNPETSKRSGAQDRISSSAHPPPAAIPAPPSVVSDLPAPLPAEAHLAINRSLFDYLDLTSAAVLSRIEGCLEGARKADARIPKLPEWPGPNILLTLPDGQARDIAQYCSCSADIVRRNMRQFKTDAAEERSQATYSQLEQCAAHAASARFPSSSPFDGARLASAAIAQLQLTCEADPTKGADSKYRMHYCSCFNDALRTNTERPFVSPQDQLLCKYIGALGQAGKLPIAATQLIWLRARAAQGTLP